MTEKSENQNRYARLTELAGKARSEVEKILKIISKEADLGSKMLKSKLDIINLDSQIDKKYRELGKETYNLIGKGEIKNAGLKLLADELNAFYNTIAEKKTQVTQLGVEMKKAAKKQ